MINHQFISYSSVIRTTGVSLHTDAELPFPLQYPKKEVKQYVI